MRKIAKSIQKVKIYHAHAPRHIIRLAPPRHFSQMQKAMKLEQKIDLILSSVITRASHKGSHARVVLQTRERILEALTGAAVKGLFISLEE